MADISDVDTPEDVCKLCGENLSKTWQTHVDYHEDCMQQAQLTALEQIVIQLRWIERSLSR